MKEAIEIGFVQGYPDGTFDPNGSVSRAEFAVMLSGALQWEDAEAHAEFADGNQIGEWARLAIDRAVAAAVINGYPDGSFRPQADITRADLAVMIARASGVVLGETVSTGFADDADIPAYAKPAIAALHEAGLIDGRGKNRFEPNATATRSGSPHSEAAASDRVNKNNIGAGSALSVVYLVNVLLDLLLLLFIMNRVVKLSHAAK